MRPGLRTCTMTIVAAALVLGACSPGADTDTGVPVASGSEAQMQSCDPVERQPIQGGTHLIGDADPPEPYSSVPGTSGWHTGNPPVGVKGEPALDRDIVAALEAGAVVLAYDPDADVDTSGLDHLVDESAGRLVVVPYAGAMPSPITLLAWGRLARCPIADFADVTSFVLNESGRVQPHEDA